jgi:hypothetical protein
VGTLPPPSLRLAGRSSRRSSSAAARNGVQGATATVASTAAAAINLESHPLAVNAVWTAVCTKNSVRTELVQFAR